MKYWLTFNDPLRLPLKTDPVDECNWDITSTNEQAPVAELANDTLTRQNT